MSKPYKTLDPLLHNELRLAIVSLLVSMEYADFSFLKKETGASSGNLSVQISKLKEAKYIEVQKQFKDNYPQTTCKITKKGLNAFENYANSLKKYLNRNQK